MCRFLCIFLMTFVHINPGKASWTGDISRALELVNYVLADILGRGSVPALSLISGYLAWNAYKRKTNWFSLFKSKFQALILPMLTWNVLIILLSLVIFLIASRETSQFRTLTENSFSLSNIFNYIFALQYGSLTEPLNFLRDIFVCSILFPLIRIFVSTLNVFSIFLIWLLGFTYGFEPLILRPSILMFFSIGVYLSLYAPATFKGKIISFIKIGIAVVGALLISKYLINGMYREVMVKQTFFMLACAVIFLIISFYLAQTNIGKKICRFDVYCFPLFLTHSFMMTIFWGAWQLFFGKELTEYYIVFYLSAPFFTFMTVVILYKSIAPSTPLLQMFLWGKKRKPCCE
ncbi:acyltransferase family protein [Glaciecola petra]|uniref:Acyltransferase family protein n=1 Tax=Glaciecola petra TaxID=3075602 RepID=A0ABU2ZUL0_9ALTE|nr:acyltransferase family protein [Aestuariibacter sp. P117]MDT0595946.1 acyltransferase family protein [Aestuariibacter sp. P117]